MVERINMLPSASGCGACLGTALLLAALLAATAAAYLPVLGYGFLLYDDDVYVSENLRLRGGLSATGIEWALTATRGAAWQPAVWLSYLADVTFCGPSPRCFHRTNLLLHLANAALLFGAVAAMGGGRLRSAVVTGLFALHPIHVEAVAWVSARKDVLSTLFFLLMLLAYVRYVRRPSLPRYLSALGLFALGLAAKPMLVTTPLLLLLLDRWPLGRLPPGWGGAAAGRGPTTRALLAEKVPFLCLSAVSAVVTYAVQSGAAAVGETAKYPLLFRLFNAATSCVAYLRKLVWPVDLAVAYPMPLSIGWGAGLAACMVVLAATGGVLAVRNRMPFLLTGWLWFVIALLPVSQLVPIGSHAMADRFAYLPFIGLYAALAWLVPPPQRRTWRAIGVAAALAAAVSCGTLTRRQVGYWEDTRTLFARSLAVSPVNWLAHNNLGVFLARQGDFAAAARHFEETLRIRPDYADARRNLELVRRDLAIAHGR
jgi:hypothetical protein